MVHKLCNTRMALTVPSDTLQEDAIQFGLPSYTKHNEIKAETSKNAAQFTPKQRQATRFALTETSEI